jgi:hypothetical protein
MQEEGALVLQGSVATVAFAFFREAVLRMVPYAVPGFVLLVLDLLYGVRAAKHRGEKVRLSTAVRRSTTKFFSYICWLILASTLALSFEMEWLEWAVLGLVYGNELASIVGNYLETKGIEVSWSDLYRWVAKAGAEKVGVTMEAAEAEGIIKDKRVRDPKTGRFIKKS